MTKLRRKRSRKKTTLRKREDKKNQTAWERKLQESKKKDGEITEVTHKNGDVIAISITNERINYERKTLEQIAERYLKWI